MPHHYPMFLNIHGWNCVIVGGGKVAFERARLLHRAGAVIRVIAPEIDRRFKDLKGVRCEARPFSPEDLEGAFIAVAATNDSELNRTVAHECTARGTLCNIVDDPDRSQFTVPALVQRGRLQIAVSTSGASPAFSRRVREEIDQWLPEDMEEYMRFLDTARTLAKEKISDSEKRRSLARHLASAQGYARFQQLHPEKREQWLKSLIDDPQQIGRQS